MTRAAAALLAALALLLTSGCNSPDVTGDSNTGNQESDPPQPSSSPSS